MFIRKAAPLRTNRVGPEDLCREAIEVELRRRQRQKCPKDSVRGGVVGICMYRWVHRNRTEEATEAEAPRGQCQRGVIARCPEDAIEVEQRRP